MDNRHEQNQRVIQITLYGLVLGCILMMLAYLAVSARGEKWPWLPGIASVFTCFGLCVAAVSVALIGRRAYQFQVGIALIYATWLLPLLLAGFQLISGSALQIMWVLGLCALNVFVSFRSAIHRLSDAELGAIGSGRLDALAGRWNLTKPLFVETNRRPNLDLAHVVMPLASGVGAAIFGLVGGNDLIFSAILMFVLVFAFVPFAVLHVAAAVYLVMAERATARHIEI